MVVENLQSNEVQKPLLDTILVFGQGPVIDRETRNIPTTEIPDKADDVNLWGKLSARAVAELYQRGQTREIHLLGGKTGGEKHRSEAEIMAEILKTQFNIPENAIKLEDKSSNTLENLVNYLNLYVDNNDQISTSKIGILTSHFHIARTKILMQLLEIPFEEAFDADAVNRYVDQQEGSSDADRRLQDQDNRLDLNATSRMAVSSIDADLSKKIDFYIRQQGTEQKDIKTRFLEEDVWTRALLEIPAYWLPYVGKLKNEARTRKILSKLDQKVLAQYEINLDQTIDEIRLKLLGIKRVRPDVDEWSGAKWEAETVKKLENLVSQSTT